MTPSDARKRLGGGWAPSHLRTILGGMSGPRLKMGVLAAGQYGLVSAAQLRALGFSDEQRRHLLASRAIRGVRRSVYRLMGVPPCWEQAVLAAVLAAGPGAVVSHATAGALWQLKHCDRATTATSIHVTAPRQLRMAAVTGHQRSLDAATLRIHRGVPVTSPEQTIIDLAATLTAARLAECIDDALRRGLIRLERLRRLVQAAGGPGRRPIVPVRRALADRIPGYDPGANGWERAMDRLWDNLGLPRSVRQHRVTANGRTYRLDRAIPHLKIGIEWNGFDSHGTRSGFDRDSDKRADLTAAGWHMLDFTSRSAPQRICQAVKAAVTQREAQWGVAAGALAG